MSEKTPWAYVATKDGQLAGVISAVSGAKDKRAKARWQKDVVEFCGLYVVDGFTVTTVYSRDEYEALIDGLRIGERLPMWRGPADTPQWLEVAE